MDKNNLVQRYGGVSGDIVWDSRSPSNFSNTNSAERNEGAQTAAKALNELDYNSSAYKNSLGIWSQVNPANPFQNNGQQAIQGLMNMKEGSDVFVYDTEILGTAPMHRKRNSVDFYTPTEIAIQHTKFINGKLQTVENSNRSLLIQPTTDVYNKLDDLIRQAAKGRWVGMTDDQRRTLSDLTLYSGDASELFDVKNVHGRKIVTVKTQNRKVHPLQGSVLSSSKNIARMQQGLKNLMEFGTAPKDMAWELNRFMQGTTNAMFAGYNVHNFDQPMMLDYLKNTVGKSLGKDSVAQRSLDKLYTAMSATQVDAFSAIKTLYKDPFSRFGARTTLERMDELINGSKKRDGSRIAHFGLSDAKVTVDTFNSILADNNVSKMISSGGKARIPGYGTWTSKNIEVGDLLFGKAGLNSHDYDGVYKRRGGVLEPAYNIKTNNIYRNTTYEVKNFFDGVDIDGKKMFGVQLYNQNDDLHHTIFRENMGELQKAIHGSLEPANNKTDAMRRTASRLQNEDRALRRWRKMFSTESGGGMDLATRLYNALDIERDVRKIAAQEGLKDEKLIKQQIDQMILKNNEWNTDEFVRDYHTMKGRLKHEESYVRSFMNKVQSSEIGGDTPSAKRAQNLAMANFGKLLDQEFGVNEYKRKLPAGSRALPINMNGETQYLNMNGVEGLKRQMYGSLYKGHVSKPNPSIVKQRYKELLGELKTTNAISAKKYEEVLGALDHIRSGDSLDNLLTELSNEVMNERDRNSKLGLSHIPAENPTGVNKTSERHRNVSKALKSGEMERIMGRAINSVDAYNMQWDGKTPVRFLGKEVEEMMDIHDKAIGNILSDSGINKDARIGFENAKNSRSSLTKLAQAFVNNGMHVQFRYNEVSKGLVMALASQKVSESVLDGSLNDLMKNNNVATVNLPRMNENGTITLGSQNRVARLTAQRSKDGSYQVVTAFDEVLQSLMRAAPFAKDQLEMASATGKKNGMLRIDSTLNRRARLAMQNLSMNNKKMNNSDMEDMYKTGSRLANWMRGRTIDISAFAEEWYTNFYETASDKARREMRLSSPDRIKTNMQSGDLFVNSMGVNARRIFQRQVDGWLSENFNINVDMHSVKDTHVSNYIRATADTRQLTPFGFFNPMARENIMKSVNYHHLDGSTVRQNLLARNFSEDRIDRILNRGVVTDKALEVMGDEVGYLNLRAAYMDDKSIAERATSLKSTYEERAKNPNLSEKERAKYARLAKSIGTAETISTFDGMFIMADDVASAFEIKREKNIRISPGAELNSAIVDKMKKHVESMGGTFDLSQDMSMDVKLIGNGVARGKNGSITISDIAKDDTFRKPVDVYDKWSNDVRIKKWDAKENVLVLEDTVKTGNSTKFVSDAGHRVTSTILPREIVEALAGGQADTILPAFETSKSQWGTEINKYVSLAVDEAKRQVESGKLTVGKLTKEETTQTVLEQIKGMMSKNISRELEKEALVKEGRIVLSDTFGIAGDNELSIGSRVDAQGRRLGGLNGFLSDVDKLLGTSFQGGKTIFGQVGMGLQDVYNWEDRIGLSNENSAGLVKYGRKEADMISSRARAVLGEESAVSTWLNSHIRNAATAQKKDIERIGSGLVRTIIEGRDVTPSSGDVVIRTTGTAFEADNIGRVTDRGVREISMNAIDNLPEVTQKNQKFTVQDYNRTILNFGRTEGTFGDGLSFSDSIKQNKGTALLEMPDETFSRKYLRLIDFGDPANRAIGTTPVMEELEKGAQQIWRGIKEYQAVGSNDSLTPQERESRVNKIRENVERSISDYEGKVAHMTSSSRDGSLEKKLGSAKMDMSGRFRIQGVSPFANYEKSGDGTWNQVGKYQEGHVYMSRQAVGEMIDGAEKNIASQIMGLTNEEISGHGRNLKSKVLDYVRDNGLYGFVNRYPTINQSTIQAMKVSIDESMSSKDRGARLTVGTAARLKADYDGDFLSTVLAHYNTDNAKAIHEDLAKLQYEEHRAGVQSAQGVMDDLVSDIDVKAKQMNLTVGELMKSHDERHIDLRNQMIGARTTRMDALESAEARLGKEFIGFVDNTRFKVLTLAQATYETLQETTGRNGSPLMTGQEAARRREIVEEFGRTFSQDLISSKKFSAETVKESVLKVNPSLSGMDLETEIEKQMSQRYQVVASMNESILNPTETNLQKFRQGNEILGLFDTSTQQGADKLDNMLSEIQYINKLNSSAGTSTSGPLNNAFLKVGLSEGSSFDHLRKTLSGQGNMVIPTDAVKNIMSIADPETAGQLEEGIGVYKKSLITNLERMSGNQDTIMDSIGKSHSLENEQLLSNAMAADEAGTKLRSIMGRAMPSGIHGGGVMAGAATFMGLWATSALMRSGPTPESMKEAAPAPPPVENLAQSQPTARVAENGEHVNIRISAKDAKNMSQEDIAALVHQEVSGMSGIPMNINLNTNDNLQRIDKNWLQQKFSDAMG